jgi:hypothetical protein
MLNENFSSFVNRFLEYSRIFLYHQYLHFFQWMLFSCLHILVYTANEPFCGTIADDELENSMPRLRLGSLFVKKEGNKICPPGGMKNIGYFFLPR